ncbi:MAG: hypothetical protein K2K14_01825 [Ruminococcus sp.]|nr:hypothetical protein [Ruminococcus sp.]
MKLREVIRYSKDLLKKRRISTMIICLLPLSSELFFRFAEATVYSLVLYFGDINPVSLFSGENPLQILTAVSSSVLRWFVGSPLIYAVSFRLCEVCYENRTHRFTTLSEILLNGKNFRRSLAVSLWTKIIGVVTLLPAGICGMTAYYFIVNGKTTNDLFITVHAIVFTVVSLFLWLNVRITMMTVPFLMAHFPNKSVFRLVCCSFRFMRGRHTDILKLFASYILPMMTIVSIPYLIPEVMTAFSLSISIYIREDDYSERVKINCRRNKANDSAKIPYRKKRRFTAIAKKAETAGFRDNL